MPCQEKYNAQELQVFDAPNMPATRSSLMALQNYLLQLPDAIIGRQDNLIEEFLGGGIYSRTMFMPKGMIIVGEIHAVEHHCTVMMGRVIVVSEFYACMMEAPYHYVAPAGDKRAFLALEDTVWKTSHATTKTNITEIEQEILSKSYEEYDQLLLTRRVG